MSWIFDNHVTYTVHTQVNIFLFIYTLKNSFANLGLSQLLIALPYVYIYRLYFCNPGLWGSWIYKSPQGCPGHRQYVTHTLTLWSVLEDTIKNISGNWELARSEFENLAQIVIWRWMIWIKIKNLAMETLD